MDDIKWFIGFLLVIGILWLGGTTKNTKRPVGVATSTPAATRTISTPAKSAPKKSAAPRTTPQGIAPQPSSGNVIADITLPEPERDSTVSPLRGKLRIISVRRANTVSQEYVTIQASSQNKTSVTITGLTIKSGVSFQSHKIPTAWALPFPTYDGSGDENVLLRPGQRAYLISGYSPNGQSFQLNKCTGYFERGMNFTPSLPLRCPRPVDDPLPLPPNSLSDACYDYLKTLPRCKVPPSSVPTRLRSDGSCQAHIFSKISYNQCVIYYRNDRNFLQGEWHLYLNRTTRLWKSTREVVQLLDENGKLIDSRTYY